MKRTLLIAEIALTLISVASLGYVGYAWWDARLTQRQGRAAVNEAKEAGNAMPPEGSVLGEIEIPRIGVSSVILEGTEDHILRRAVGHVPGTARPGEPGNVAIAGHRDTFFRPLRGIAIGDEIVLKSARQTLIYHVQSAQIVNPRDVHVLNKTPTEVLTLITCYPFNFIGAAPNRFVVRATRTFSGRTDPSS